MLNSPIIVVIAAIMLRSIRSDCEIRSYVDPRLGTLAHAETLFTYNLTVEMRNCLVASDRHTDSLRRLLGA